jgi:hypothetical protein
MRTTYLFQTSGTIAVVGAFLASELVARLLALFPSSETLWYLQLGVLRPLSTFRASGMLMEFLPGLNMLLVPAMILAMALLACIYKQRILIGVMTNCSVILLACIGYTYLSTSGIAKTASIAPLVSAATPNLVLLMSLGILTIAGCVACHVSFIRDVLRESAKPIA